MWPNLQLTIDLVLFTEEILLEKLHFLCSEGAKTMVQVIAKNSIVFTKNIT